MLKFTAICKSTHIYLWLKTGQRLTKPNLHTKFEDNGIKIATSKDFTNIQRQTHTRLVATPKM